ncbi:MAG TPA: hypothetical protein VE650_17605 [Acetobacteraceae bacterium]|nr:hypothetical protein [Acetobacteraceae bacterium]
MDWFETLVARTSRIQRPARIALACRCAERVRPVYETLREDAAGPLFQDAVEAAWRLAETGQRDPRLATLRQQLEALLNDYLDMGYSLLSDAVTVAFRAVQATNEEEQDSAIAVARALASALSVADGAEAAIIPPGTETSGAFQKEEEAWQAAALDLCERWRGPASRTMFDPISPPGGPQWVKRFLAALR